MKQHNSEKVITTKTNRRFIKKVCHLCSSSSDKTSSADHIIDYKNPEFLRRFVSEGGRILPRRIENICAKHQRALTSAIKASRFIALMPFISSSR